jgi:hypothetical protein
MDQRKQFLGDIKNILHFFLQDLTILPCHGVPTKLSSPSISSATCLSPLVRNCENPLRNKNLNYVAVSPNIYLHKYSRISVICYLPVSSASNTPVLHPFRTRIISAKGGRTQLLSSS